VTGRGVRIPWSPAVALEIQVARQPNIAPLFAMGAKYLPTIKDIKASQRFQEREKQKLLLKSKAAGVKPARKAKRK